MNWKDRAGAVVKFSLRNLDALFVIVLAAVVFVLEFVGTPSEELLDSTILALLGVMALVMLRDRHSRSRVDEIASYVEDIRSDRPYQVHWDLNTWDIRDKQHATFTKTQGLQFTRNKVCTMEHWCTGSVGTVQKCHAHWRLRPDKPWERIDSIHDFGINSGRKYIFCLETERSRGDALEWKVSRELNNRFPNARESVSLRLQAPTHRPRMQVVWPRNRKPRMVEIFEDGGSSRQLEPQPREDGRVYVDELLGSGTDSLVKIEWTW